jgi:hypothetical protein
MKTEKSSIIFCDFNCGNIYKYILKNGKKCCQKSFNKCPCVKERNKLGLKKAYDEGRRTPLTHEGYKDRMAWSRGKDILSDNRVGRKYKPSDIFCENSHYSKYSLKKLIINNNLIEYKCQGVGCLISNEWLSKKIVLELDHINGKNNDNRLENLRYLCPNCHSQTPTFRKAKSNSNKRSKGITDGQIIDKLEQGINKHKILSELNLSIGMYPRLHKIEKALIAKINHQCIKCNKKICKNSKSGLCINCVRVSKRKCDRPPYEQLKKEVEEQNYSSVGRKYHVSDNAIRKWLKEYEKER